MDAFEFVTKINADCEKADLSSLINNEGGSCLCCEHYSDCKGC